ncbi:T9SS type A sorting domain-containing protein [Cytophagaceae bacterium YF14B1]|uniref:T9SS type A sorting domain-containing protein n=1 Tax=Xanthocytophaga flava TaxID=3048013 RepID=A0AAE3UBV7_9BACT|nr:T9SS type A sorting domain-containing protein [Xanthocytophaga flavus]MDJ1486152.1 T9SS type A sorting domain-containing protein [Xanthocytophaga flavus]
MPDIEFLIGDGNGNDVVAYTSPAPIPNDGQWHKVGFTFTTKPGVTTLELKIRNKAPGGGGNDIALDNFSFRACGPTVSLQNNFPACNPSAQIQVASIGSAYATPQYQWQVSSNNGVNWSDISGATSSTYSPVYPVVKQGNLVRLKVAGSSVNLSSTNCYVTTNSQAVNCLIPLPVTLLSFTGYKIATGVQLNWQTSEERDNKYFVVERSTNGITFTTVCLLLSQGNSNQLQSYSCQDSSPLPGRNYYRLKQIDMNGQSTYSKVIPISYDSDLAASLSLAPNPAKGTIRLVFTSAFSKHEQIRIQFISLIGQLIEERTQNIASNTYELEIDTGNLADGIYLIKVTTQAKTYIEKLIVSQ